MMTLQSALGGAAAVLILLTGRPACGQAQPTELFDPVAALESAFSRAGTVQLKMHAAVFEEGGPYQKETRTATLTAIVIRDGLKWRVAGSRSTDRLRDGKPRTYKGGFEYLIDDRRLISVTWGTDDTRRSSAPGVSATFDQQAMRERPGTGELYQGEVPFGEVPNHIHLRLQDVVRSAGKSMHWEAGERGPSVAFQDHNGRWTIQFAGESP